jgi:RNA polymerase sigma-70 factor (ECF subfamily)
MKNKTKLISEIAIAATLLAVAALAQAVKEYSVKSMPPAVVKTVPQAGATDVDPALKELKFTFSKDMMDGNWSVCQISKEHYPETAGKIYYLPDKRTCVMPVKLQPGRTYLLWLNLGKFQNFRDSEGHSSVPYQLVFETRK